MSIIRLIIQPASHEPNTIRSGLGFDRGELVKAINVFEFPFFWGIVAILTLNNG